MKKINLPKKPTYIPFKVDENIYNLFLQIEQENNNCFFLESLGEEGRMSRYSILGFNPDTIITEESYFAFRDYISQDIFARNYAGGLVGYLSYDAMRFFEPTISLKIHKLFPTILFGLYTDGIIYDKVTAELVYFYYKKNRLSYILDILKIPVKKKYLAIKNLNQSTSKPEHAKMVTAAKEEILSGNTFQTNLSLQTEFNIKGEAVELYTRLRKINPSPFMYYLKFDSPAGEIKIIGASPELLFGMRNKEMQTFPLAGTIKRGKTTKEDMQLARTLLNNKKEIAEHMMLVDLHRNDLGRVARFGSVKVRSLMDIKRFSHVQHISSEVVGLLEQKEDMFSALARNFPAGTLTGAPKIESIKIIDRIERQARGPYGGAVGHFGFNGDCTFAIPIRTIFINGNYGYTQAGSGIVYDSLAEKEYEEIQRKMQATKEVLV